MLAIALVFLVIFVQIKAKIIDCETIESTDEWNSITDKYSTLQETCLLNGTTVISDENVELGGIKNVNVDTILLNNNKKIEFLPVRVYKTFPNLEIYLASEAAIKKISALNFAGLSKLEFLILDFNKIEIIPEDCFQELIQLQEIDLDSNKIKTVNALAFDNLPQLGLINLWKNACINKEFTIKSDLSEIRRKLSRRCWSAKPRMSCFRWTAATGYRTVNICEVEPLTYADKPDFKLTLNSTNNTFEILVIQNQRHVDFLPVSVHEQCPNLREYKITNTPIRKISKKNFEKLKMLEELLLDRNQIEEIKSDTFEDLINLERINITNQPLIALNGKAFTNLPQLEYLGLLDNKCINRFFFGFDKKTVPNEISEKCGFEEFDSIDIECESYSYTFTHPWKNICFMTEKTVINASNFIVGEKDEQMQAMFLFWNKQVEYLPYKIFMQLPNLAEIDAFDCSIKQISKENFENLFRLREINLQHNQINEIFGDTFKGLESLKWVDLRYNQIKSISGRTFDQLPLLSYVDLRGNKCIDDMFAQNFGLHVSIKNFTRAIIQQCSFAGTRDRKFAKVFEIECGDVKKERFGFIVGGSETYRGKWPFMVALVSTTKNQFLCGGSVITTSHVLTAAHCVQNKHDVKPKNASEIDLHFGRHKILSQAEVGSEIRKVNNIKIHPHWNPNDKKYGGDIAVLEMDRPVQFSELIQPVCLTFEPELSQQEAGFVVGWGKSGQSSARHEKTLRQVSISSVTTEVCFDKDYMLGSMFSKGMFCAGGKGFGPCHGDSGGGFFVRYEGLWTLRGIVSSGTSRDDFSCDVDRYTLFTNALDYAEWIKDACKIN